MPEKRIITEGMIKKGGVNDEDPGEPPKMLIPPMNQPNSQQEPSQQAQPRPQQPDQDDR